MDPHTHRKTGIRCDGLSDEEAQGIYYIQLNRVWDCCIQLNREAGLLHTDKKRKQGY